MKRKSSERRRGITKQKRNRRIEDEKWRRDEKETRNKANIRKRCMEEEKKQEKEVKTRRFSAKKYRSMLR